MKIKEQSYGLLNLGEGVQIELTVSMVDEWFRSLTDIEKIALYMRDTQRRDLRYTHDLLETAKLRFGLAAYMQMLDEIDAHDLASIPTFGVANVSAIDMAIMPREQTEVSHVA